jgi:hypothetical protein
MRGLAALVLAGVLVAPASFAQILGDQSGLLGGDAGFLRSSGPSVTIDAMPFARTVTCSDYTLTGTAPGAGAVSWAASPSGASGACTGTTSWSCVVDVNPANVGEGVEVITVTQGALTDTETIGFYVDGEHSCFLAQSYDGAYNAGKADLAAVATWVNLGSSALNVTQATGSAQPTYRTGIVNGQPMVRFDGTDRLTAALPADWIFLHDGTGATIDSISMTSVSQTGAIASTSATGFTTGIRHRVNGSFIAQYSLLNGVAAGSVASAASALTSGAFDALTSTASAADTPDLTLYINNVSVGTPVDAPSFPAGNPTTALSIGATGAGANPLTGDIFRVMAYVSSLSATQRGINLAVDEWALGGTLPVTP